MQKLPASEGQEFFEASEAVYAAFKALRPAFPSPAKPELSAALPFFSELCRRLSLHPNRPFKHLIFSTEKEALCLSLGYISLITAKARSVSLPFRSSSLSALLSAEFRAARFYCSNPF